MCRQDLIAAAEAWVAQGAGVGTSDNMIRALVAELRREVLVEGGTFDLEAARRMLEASRPEAMRTWRGALTDAALTTLPEALDEIERLRVHIARLQPAEVEAPPA